MAHTITITGLSITGKEKTETINITADTIFSIEETDRISQFQTALLNYN